MRSLLSSELPENGGGGSCADSWCPFAGSTTGGVVLKLADLGLTKTASLLKLEKAERQKRMVSGGHNDTSDHGSFNGTPRWSAPEVLSGEAYTPAADIFSLAMTLYEIASGKVPLEECRTESAAETAILAGTRPTMDVLRGAPFPRELAAVIASGWEAQQELRPSATEFLGMLIHLCSPTLRTLHHMVTALDIIGDPRTRLLGDRRYNVTVYRNCLVAQDVVRAWVDDPALPHITTVEKAVALGQEFVSLGVLTHVTADHDFENQFLFYYVDRGVRIVCD